MTSTPVHSYRDGFGGFKVWTVNADSASPYTGSHLLQLTTTEMKCYSIIKNKTFTADNVAQTPSVDLLVL